MSFKCTNANTSFAAPQLYFVEKHRGKSRREYRILEDVGIAHVGGRVVVRR